MKKFDVCITNPPYGGKDIKILTRLLSRCNQIISIHPAIWILSKKPNINKRISIYKRRVTNHLKYIRIFNGNRIFKISSYLPLCICNIYPNKNIKQIKVNYFNDKYNTDNIDNITIYGSNWYKIKFLFDRIKSYCEKNGSLQDHWYNITQQEYDNYIQIANIRGHVNNKIQLPCIKGSKEIVNPNKMFKNDFYTFLMKNPNKNKGIRKKAIGVNIIFSFDTEQEQNNFLDYLGTKFSRFCLSFYKASQHIDSGELSIVPWLDFKKNYTNDVLLEMFDVKHLKSYINNFIPDW